MTELLTAAQMREIEKTAIDSGVVTGLELMERAGAGVVEAILEEWPELGGLGTPDGGAAPRPAAVPRDISEKLKRAVVLCGPGNNGGDGFVVARLLKERGWAVEVYLFGEAQKLPPDAQVNYARWRKLGAVTPYIDEGEGAFRLDPAEYRETSVLIDALFGTGLTRPVEAFNAFGWLTQVTEGRLDKRFRTGELPAPRVVSIDLPSGICADSGALLCCPQPIRALKEIRADLTVSFHRMKLGHVLGAGPGQSGKVIVKDIGLTGGGALAVEAAGTPADARHVVRLAAPPSGGKVAGHKYTHGHALVLTGGAGRTGAARLAARGALRIGAGLVTLAVPPTAQMEVACQITALMLQRAEGAAGLAAVLEDQRINALCLGPGLGQKRARDLVPVALAAQRATVLDADALSGFAEDPQLLFDRLHETCVLTPHGGEFARLFPDIADRLAAPASRGPAYSKVDATRDAAKRAGCTVLLKGADTVIADPDGRCSVHAAVRGRAAPWLATAGSGDVLAGFITGLLARGFAPHLAGVTAAWLHVDCALAFGPGLIAEDLPEQLPQALRRIGL